MICEYLVYRYRRGGIATIGSIRRARGKSAKRVFALDIPGIHVFKTSQRQ
jgi:hypothetical protein